MRTQTPSQCQRTYSPGMLAMNYLEMQQGKLFMDIRDYRVQQNIQLIVHKLLSLEGLDSFGSKHDHEGNDMKNGCLFKLPILVINVMMYEFKQDEEEDALSNLQHYSEEELSLLNSRKRPCLEHSERGTETDRQNQEEIREFKREIEERFKLSIANKIYTFPKVIRSITDIISSDEDNPLELFKNKELGDISNFKKVKYITNSSKNKPNDSLRPFEGSTSKEGRTLDTKKGKQKQKTNDSSSKRRGEELKEKTKYQKGEKIGSGGKKKTERLKTEQDCVGSFTETLRNKAQRKN